MRFRFRPALTAATLAALSILCALGGWQTQRLAWKNALIEKTEARIASAPVPLDEALTRAEGGEDMEYQPVFATGAWREGAGAKVFAAHDGQPGVLLFTPFETGGRVVFVNRGFVPQDEVARIPAAAGLSRVEGLFRNAEVKSGFERLLAPKDQPTDNLYFTRDPRSFAGAPPGAPGYYIDSFDEPRAAPWPKGGLTRVAFPNRHLEYALTWFGLAAALLGVYLAFSLRRD